MRLWREHLRLQRSAMAARFDRAAKRFYVGSVTELPVSELFGELHEAEEGHFVCTEVVYQGGGAVLTYAI